MAAHELPTPIQPILGLSEVLHTKIKDTEQRQLLDTSQEMQKGYSDSQKIYLCYKAWKSIIKTKQRKIWYKQKNIKCYKRYRKANLWF